MKSRTTRCWWNWIAHVMLVFALVSCARDHASLTIASPGRSASAHPELVVQSGHGDQVTQLAFSPSGELLATASLDGTVRLWDLDVGAEMRTLRGPTGWVGSVAFSDDGRRIAAGGLDKVVYIWDVESGELVRKLEGLARSVSGLEISPDGETVVATGQVDFAVWRGDGKAVKYERLAGFGNYLFAFSPNGRSLAMGSAKELKIWDTTSWTVRHTVELSDGRGEPALPVFSGDGKWIAVRDGMSGAVLVDASSAEIQLELADGLPIDAVGFDAESGDLMVVRADGQSERYAPGTKVPSSTVGRLDPRAPGGEDPDPPQQARPFEAGKVRAHAYPSIVSADGSQLAEVWPDRSIHRWDLGTGRPLARLGGNFDFLGPEFIGNATKQVHAVWNPKRAQVAAGGKDELVHLWDLARGGEPQTLSGFSGRIAALAYSPDGRVLAVGASNKLWLWSADGELLDELVLGDYTPASIQFSPNGEQIAIGGFLGQVTAVDVAELKVSWSHTVTDAIIGSVDYSADGKIVYATSRLNAGLGKFDAASGRAYGMDHVHRTQIIGADLAPGNNRMVFAGGEMVTSLGSTYTVEANDLMVTDLAEFDGRADSLRVEGAIAGHETPVWSLRVTPGGKRAVSGDMGGVLKLWNLDTGEQIASVEGHSSHVSDIDLSHDGRYVVTSSHDQTVKIWDAESLAPIATMMTLGPDDYVLALDDSYYMASAGGHRGLAFRHDGELYPFEQFDLRLNRPDLVLGHLGYATEETIEQFRKAYVRRLTKMGLREEMLDADFHAPDVRVDDDGIPVTTTRREIAFHVLANDTREPLDRLNVWVNDVPLWGAGGVDLRQRNTQVVDEFVELELGAGVNKIQVSALNQRGGESLRKTFEVTYLGDTPAPELWVVAIGVSDYRDDRLDLEYASKDAKDLVTAVGRESGRFSKVHAKVLTDGDASKRGILAARKFLEGSTVDDQAVVFLAGHGVLDEELDYYFLPADVKVRRLTKTAVRYEDLEGLLDGIPARERLLLMDTCHSGEVDDPDAQDVPTVGDQKGARGLPEDVRVTRDFRGLELTGPTTPSNATLDRDLLKELFADLRRGSGAMVISSAGGAEYALESSEWNNGVFTMAVLEALKHGAVADENGDGTVRVSELRHYVTERVRKLTAGQQTPTARRENLERDFSALR